MGIGVLTPATKLSVSGGLQIGLEASACAAGLAGTLRYSGGVVEFCNGSAWTAFGVSGAGLTLLNGSASNTQTFANGISGLRPAFATLNGVHTLNIPFAASACVAAGLLSNADYSSFAAKASAASLTALSSTVSNLSTSMSSLSSDLTAVSATATNVFNTANAVSSSVSSLASTVANKITSSAAAIEQVLGYLPAASGSAINSQWVTSGTGIHYIAGNVGIGTSVPVGLLNIVRSTGTKIAQT